MLEYKDAQRWQTASVGGTAERAQIPAAQTRLTSSPQRRGSLHIPAGLSLVWRMGQWPLAGMLAG